MSDENPTYRNELDALAAQATALTRIANGMDAIVLQLELLGDKLERIADTQDTHVEIASALAAPSIGSGLVSDSWPEAGSPEADDDDEEDEGAWVDLPACPYCMAAPGEPCVTASQAEAEAPHAARLKPPQE